MLSFSPARLGYRPVQLLVQKSWLTSTCAAAAASNYAVASTAAAVPPKPSKFKVSWSSLASETYVATSPDTNVQLSMGPRAPALEPKPLLLAALGGCIVACLVGILQKQRLAVQHINVALTGTPAAKLPHYYTSIQMDIQLASASLITQKQANRALELALVYCPVHRCLSVPVLHSICIVDKQ